jgi:hypothetical protein
MQMHKLIASVAAVLFTATSLGVLSNQIASQTRPDAAVHGSTVIDLAPVTVHPSAAERRAAALLTDTGAVALVSSPLFSQIGSGTEAGRFSLIQSQLAMPYYSFGNKFGRISKE